jgi:hypothetical protein
MQNIQAVKLKTTDSCKMHILGTGIGRTTFLLNGIAMA